MTTFDLEEVPRTQTVHVHLHLLQPLWLLQPPSAVPILESLQLIEFHLLGEAPSQSQCEPEHRGWDPKSPRLNSLSLSNPPSFSVYKQQTCSVSAAAAAQAEQRSLVSASSVEA